MHADRRIMPIYRKVSWSRAARFAKKNPTGRRYKRAVPLRSRGASRKRLVKLIKKVAIKQSESKRKAISISKTEIFHNSFNVAHHINLSTYMPSQGTADDQRVGDEINISGYRLKMLLGQKGDRPNVNWKWWVLKIPKGSAATYSNWFRVQTGNVMLDDPNTDFVKVLKSGYWRPNQAGLTGTGDDEFTFVKQMWLPYRKNLKFGPGGATVTHNDDDLYFCLVCYDAFGTLVTDNIAYIQMQSEIFYRDP